MTGPEQHANTVRDALHGDRVTDPVENWAAADRALDALVALAERADTLKRERDDLRFWNNRVRVCENHTDEVAAPADDCLVCELTEARAEADRLREALEPVRTFVEYFVPVEEALTNGFDVEAWCRHAGDALAGPQTKEQT